MRSSIITLLPIFGFTISKPVLRESTDSSTTSSRTETLLSTLENAAAGPPHLVKKQDGLFGLPQSSVSSDKPIGNAALWQEALNNDAAATAPGAVNAENTNQNFYQTIQFAQSQENSSLQQLNSFGNAVESAAFISEGLQGLQIYPMRFDQAQAADPAKSIIEILPTAQQTIKSFGASGAWWSNALNEFPPAQQQNLSDLLFSEDWLYLSGYRYNMGASGDKDTTTVTTVGRGVESFMKTDGTYDWTRDPAGIYYLNAAATAGASITFFINAAPGAIMAKLQPCGQTLDASNVTKFVNYIETVLAHWSDQKITIDHISPMNEPDNDFDSCSQEGMAVSKSTRPAVFQALQSALQNSQSVGAKTIKIMGDESSQIASNAMNTYSSWLPSTLSTSSVDALSVHMYDWPDDATLANYAVLVKNLSSPNPPPPIKMTEISTFKSASGPHAPWGITGPNTMKGTEWDPTMNNALDMARYVWQWLTIVNAESWDWWTAVSKMMPCSPATQATCGTTYNNTNGYNDGLLYIDPQYATTKNYNFYFTKRFWVFRHFTKFIRPGSVRYDIPNEVLPYGTVAVASLGMDKTWNTIFINRNATSQYVTMKLPASGGKVLGVTQTTDALDWGSVDMPTVAADDTVKLTLPARGVLSMQFSVRGPVSARSSEEINRRADEGSTELRKRRWTAGKYF